MSVPPPHTSPPNRPHPDGPAAPGATTARRGPRVFSPNDPGLVVARAEPDPPPPGRISLAPASPSNPDGMPIPGLRATVSSMAETGFRWGLLLASALASAAALAASLWFARFISVGFERDDWIGLTIRALMAVAAFAAVVVLLREWLGWRRLGRLGRLRADVDKALASQDVRAERKITDRVLGLYQGRPELAWALDRVKSHRADVHDPRALLTLVDRDLMAGLDTSARRQITSSAKRVATVTALSPMASIALGFVIFENLRLLRQLAAIYGGRPGLTGALRLGRRVIGNLIAAGGIALTDDLLGQFIGQDVLRRLSRRLGEGAFNGALTARIGVATIVEVRPLPFIEADPLRVRDILAEVVRPSATPEPASAETAQKAGRDR